LTNYKPVDVRRAEDAALKAAALHSNLEEHF